MGVRARHRLRVDTSVSRLDGASSMVGCTLLSPRWVCCATGAVTTQVVTVLDASSVISHFGLWWPKADEDQLDSAAGAWDKMATALDHASSVGTSAAGKVTSGNEGAAIDAFGAYWGKLDGSPEAPLPATATACRAMAKALRDYADKVRDARKQVWEIALTIAATIAAGIGLAWCTFGISAGAAAAATTALCASVGILEGTIAAAVVSVVMAALVGAAFGAAEAFVISFAVAQPIRMAFHPGTGFSLDEALDYAKGGAVLGGAFGGGGAAFRALRGAEGPAIQGIRAPSVPSSADVGAARELRVAQLEGGEVQGRPGEPGLKVTQPGAGTTDVDVIGGDGAYVAVGGPAKAANLSKLGQKLHILRYAADQAGVPARAYFEAGTPQSAIDLAIRILGKDNVIIFGK